MFAFKGKASGNTFQTAQLLLWSWTLFSTVMPPADKSQTMENLGNLLATNAVARWFLVQHHKSFFLAGHYQQPTKVVSNLWWPGVTNCSLSLCDRAVTSLWVGKIGCSVIAFSFSYSASSYSGKLVAQRSDGQNVSKQSWFLLDWQQPLSNLPTICNESESVCAGEWNSSAIHLFATGDLTQLVATWLHSICMPIPKLRFLGAYVIL